MFVSCLERLRLVSLFLPAFVKSFSPILSGGFRARGTAPITSRIYAHSCHPSCRCVLFHRIAKKFISAAGPQIRIHSSIVYAPILRPVKCQFSLDTSRRRFTLTSVSLPPRTRRQGAIRASYKFANLFARGRSHFRTNERNERCKDGGRNGADRRGKDGGRWRRKKRGERQVA